MESTKFEIAANQRIYFLVLRPSNVVSVYGKQVFNGDLRQKFH